MIRPDFKVLHRITRGLWLCFAASLLSGCASFDDLTLPEVPIPNINKLFAKPEVKLPGKRIAVMRSKEENAIAPTAAFTPITLPAPITNAAWSQPGGVPSNAPGHLGLSGSLKMAWSADAGRGSTSKGKLTASPLVYNGKLFTLDTRGQVKAFSAGSGKKVWGASLTPENERDYEGFGGGLAADGGRLFAATGFGTVNAINPDNGSKLWSVSLGAPIRSSPTASGGRLFVVTTEGKLYCLAGVDGQKLWSHRGLPESATLFTNASPAVSGDTVVVPYPSGEVIAFKISTGKPYWAETLTRRRAGSSLSALTNPSRPVIYGGTVFAVSHAGRMVATAANTGERLWTQNIQGLQAPWVVGSSVFVVDVNGKLMAINRRDGKIRWVKELPGKGFWSGPVLAGGKLWLVSSKGLLVGADAGSGKIIGQKKLGTKIMIAPVVANGRMYLLTDKARLIALN